MADTMMRIGNYDLATKFLTKEEIMKKCPLAYKESPTNNRVSDKYVLVNTARVIEDMASLGWGVVDVRQRKAQEGSSGRFSYHMVAFQNPNIKITKKINTGEEVVDCYPRIILTNSHDGLNCFKFMVGLFRLVCSNGLVIATDQMVDLKIRHIYYNIEELRNVLVEAVEQVAQKVNRMTVADNTILTDTQAREFAKKAIAIRKEQEVDEVVVDDETISEMLEPQRNEDKGNSLWKVFNVLQEKIIKGGFSETTPKGKVRKVRKVTSFVKDLDINRQLWQVMESYIPAAQAA